MSRGQKRMLKLLLVICPLFVAGFFVAHFLNGEVPTDQEGNILKNAGFEQEAHPKRTIFGGHRHLACLALHDERARIRGWP